MMQLRLLFVLVILALAAYEVTAGCGLTDLIKCAQKVAKEAEKICAAGIDESHRKKYKGCFDKELKKTSPDFKTATDVALSCVKPEMWKDPCAASVVPEVKECGQGHLKNNAELKKQLPKLLKNHCEDMKGHMVSAMKCAGHPITC